MTVEMQKGAEVAPFPQPLEGAGEKLQSQFPRYPQPNS